MTQRDRIVTGRSSMAKLLAVVLLAAGLSSAGAQASQVRLVNLEQMTQRASRIFSGRCTGARVVFDTRIGHDVTVSTFVVDRAVKGVTGRTVTVRTFASSKDATALDEPAEVPTFRNGEEVVLFLYGESALGLSAPVGLGQGSFRVTTDKQGRKIALNDFGNRNLLTGVHPATSARLGRGRSGGLEVDPQDLIDTVRALIAASR